MNELFNEKMKIINNMKESLLGLILDSEKGVDDYDSLLIEFVGDNNLNMSPEKLAETLYAAHNKRADAAAFLYGNVSCNLATLLLWKEEK